MPLFLHASRLSAATDTPDIPLLIAHGLLGQARNFGTLARGFAKKRHVITVDMRNHGESPWDEVMDYNAMADDLAAAIEIHCGEYAHVLGHSMGGKAAMMLALKYPNLLASLTVADIAPVAYDHEYYKEIDAMRQVGLEGVSRRSQVNDVLGRSIPDAAMRAFLLQNLSIKEGTVRWKPNLDVLYRSMPDITGWPELEAGTVYDRPVLFIRGGNSLYVQEHHKKSIYSWFPRAQYATIKDAGHWLHAEKPEPFFNEIDTFIDRLF